VQSSEVRHAGHFLLALDETGTGGGDAGRGIHLVRAHCGSGIGVWSDHLDVAALLAQGRDLACQVHPPFRWSAQALELAFRWCPAPSAQRREHRRFHARILGAVSRKESDDKSRRLTRKHLELATAGKVSGGGTRPFGYAKDRITLIPEEAEIIKEMAERLLAGDSLRSIAANLNDRDVPTVTGRQWTTHSVRQLLYSARISGQREHHSEIVGKASWQAIIKPAQTTRIRALLNDPERRTNRVARKYLLAGLLRCGNCGTTMVSRPRSDGRGRYVCSRDPGRNGCGSTFILADQVDAFIADAVVHRLDTPRLAASMRRRAADDPAVASVIHELERDQEQLDELAASYGEKEISHREWLAARAPIQARIKTANATLNRGQRTTALAGILDNPDRVTETYEALPLARQHAIVKAVLNYAQIGPAVRGRNRFDPGRISPAWRLTRRGFVSPGTQQRRHLLEGYFILDPCRQTLLDGGALRPFGSKPSDLRTPRYVHEKNTTGGPW
jgi:site-specific DNA recombinase